MFIVTINLMHGSHIAIFVSVGLRDNVYVGLSSGHKSHSTVQCICESGT